MDVTAFGESGTGKRVNHVLKYKKTGICIMILAVIVLAAVSIVCLTDREPEEGNLSESTADLVEKTYFWGQQELEIKLSEENQLPAMSLVGRSVLSMASETEEGYYGSSIGCVGEHCFFQVRPFYREESTAYELQVFDGDSKEWNSGYLEMDLLEQGYIYGMFAVSDQELAYLIPVHNSDKNWKYDAYYAVHMSRTGRSKSVWICCPPVRNWIWYRTECCPSISVWTIRAITI